MPARDRKERSEREAERLPAKEQQSGRIIIPGQERQEADTDQLLKERDEYLETARRARADYVNLQRRMEAQYLAAREDARSQLALDMLAILDDLERALEHGREGEDYDGLLEGIALVREKFLAALARYEIRPIDAQGAPFDHNFHDAVAEQPAEEAPAGTVIAVVQTGYTIGEKLLRPARVVVARVAGEAGAQGEGAGQSEDQE